MTTPPRGPESDAPVKPGDLIDGKYLVSDVIGAGGMGVVVAAKHLMLEQQVALKFLLPRALGNPEAVARFVREAKAIARLRGPHVARVFDSGMLPGGAPYIAMELLEGRDLSHLLAQRGALPISEAVDLLLQACEAVAEAHAAGIVHRDLKPQNLFVTQSVEGKPLVKVLDFGISKVLDDSVAAITQTANMMGSPAYMPPEQMRSAKSVSFASDLWALGVILYEMVTGRLPFEGTTIPELCVKVTTTEPVDPAELRADLPAGLRDVIQRLLKKDPALRYAGIGELAAALEPFGDVAAAGAGQRVAAIARTSMQPPPKSDEAAIAKVPTEAGWGTTQLAPDVPKRPRWGIGAAVAVVCAFGALAVYASKSSGTAEHANAGTTTASAPIAASAAPVPSAEVAVPVVPIPAPPPTPPAASASTPAPRASHEVTPATPATAKIDAGTARPPPSAPVGPTEIPRSR